MTKKSNRSEIQHLETIIKEQKAAIKELRKELSRNIKRTHMYEDLEIRLSEEIHKDAVQMLPKNACPECGKASLELIDLKARKMKICKNCGYRQVTK